MEVIDRDVAVRALVVLHRHGASHAGGVRANWPAFDDTLKPTDQNMYEVLCALEEKGWATQLAFTRFSITTLGLHELRRVHRIYAHLAELTSDVTPLRESKT